MESLDSQNPEEVILSGLEMLAASVFLPDNRKFICRQACLEALVGTFKRFVTAKDGNYRKFCLEILSACVKESDEVIAKLIRMGIFDYGILIFFKIYPKIECSQIFTFLGCKWLLSKKSFRWSNVVQKSGPFQKTASCTKFGPLNDFLDNKLHII